MFDAVPAPPAALGRVWWAVCGVWRVVCGGWCVEGGGVWKRGMVTFKLQLVPVGPKVPDYLPPVTLILT